MEYKKKSNLSENTPNQPAKFKNQNCVEINYESHGLCDTGSQMKF